MVFSSSPINNTLHRLSNVASSSFCSQLSQECGWAGSEHSVRAHNIQPPCWFGACVEYYSIGKIWFDLRSNFEHKLRNIKKRPLVNSGRG